MKTPHFGIVATAVFSLAGWAAAQPRLELAIGIGILCSLLEGRCLHPCLHAATFSMTRRR